MDSMQIRITAVELRATTRTLLPHKQVCEWVGGWGGGGGGWGWGWGSGCGCVRAAC